MSTGAWVLGPFLWALRTFASIVMLIILWSDTMDGTEMILSLPAEFFPIALVIGAVAGLMITSIKGMSAYYEYDKEQARKGKGKVAYGFDYLSANVGTVIGCALLSPILTGCYYHAADATPDIYGVIGIAATVGVICAVGGDKLIQVFLESRRDSAKAKDARSKSEKTENQ